MKSITIFGKKIVLKIEDSKKFEETEEKIESKERIISNRLIFLALMLSFFVMSSKFSYINSDYKIGKEVQKDIISPISTKFVDEERRRELIAKLLSQEEGIFERNGKIEQDVFFNINSFFNGFNQPKIENVESEFDKLLRDNFSQEEIKILTDKEKREELEEDTKKYLEELFQAGIKNNSNGQEELNEAILLIPNKIIAKILTIFAKPNFLYSYEKTEEALRNKIANIDDVEVVVQAGDVIVKKGTILKPEDLKILRKVGVYSLKDNIKIFGGNLLYVIVVSVLFVTSLKKVMPKQIFKKQQFYGTALALFLYLLAIRLTNLRYINIFPFESIALMLGILFGVEFATIMSVFIVMYTISIIGYNYIVFVTGIVSIIFSIYSIRKISTRTDIINTGIYIGILKLMIGLGVSSVAKIDFVDQIFRMVELFLSGLLSAMVVIALLPYFENTFNILTKMKLVELGDLSHPLLKRMSLEAPGTFHHSMLVATLSEQAAEAVGADSVFTRVACYYHDIGKMKRSNFYVENQSSGINPHDKLSPTLSTMIIKAHTKDGQEMGKEYKIPKEIRDIMAEHQGTTFLAYFYNKAKKENPDILESDFRYDGPVPRSKESAIIMMADSIEAAVRSLDEKDPVSIERMIRKIISSKMDDNQFAEADITLKEVEIIMQSFVKTLKGIYHTRIKYPDQKKEEGK
jgi:hypothetical protein